jgi:hypothetical protein
VNCWVEPGAIDAVLGVTAIEVNTTPPVTVSVPEPLIVPDVAVIVAVPGEMAVAKPLLLIVATEVAEDDHVALFVRFWVVPLL